MLIVPLIEPVMEMKNLSMQWGTNPILDKLDMEMNPGERLAIVGPSGAGKSTLLRVLAGLLLPTNGELKLFGEDQTYLRLDQSHPPDVRLVFQNPCLLGSLTVGENVGFLLKRSGKLSEKNIKERVISSLQEVGLYDVADQYPSELSGGMQKRVSFARALIDDPSREDATSPILLFDEPTAGLDPVTATRIEDLIVKTTTIARGCSIVVSHLKSTVERSAKKILMLYEGQFKWQGSTEEYKESSNPYVKQFRTGSLQGPMQPTDQ